MNNVIVRYGNCAKLKPPLFRGIGFPSGYSFDNGLQRRCNVNKSHLELYTMCAVNPSVAIVPERFVTNVSVAIVRIAA